MEEFPCDLKSNHGLAGARRQREQDALLIVGDGVQHALDGEVPKIPLTQRAALVLEWHGGEAIAPSVRYGKRHVPEFVRRGVARQIAFVASLHVDAVDALAVGGIREPDGHFRRVILGLRHAFRQRLVPRFGLVHGQLAIAINQHVIGDERLAAATVAFDAAQRDRIFAQDLAAFDDAPARRFQCRIYMLGAGFGFVHLMFPVTAWLCAAFFTSCSAASSSRALASSRWRLRV